MQGLDEAARDGEAEPGAGAYPVALFRPIELVEDVLQVSGRYTVAFVQHLKTDRVLVAPAPDADGGAVHRAASAGRRMKPGDGGGNCSL